MKFNIQLLSDVGDVLTQVETDSHDEAGKALEYFAELQKNQKNIAECKICDCKFEYPRGRR